MGSEISPIAVNISNYAVHNPVDTEKITGKTHDGDSVHDAFSHVVAMQIPSHMKPNEEVCMLYIAVSKGLGLFYY